MIDNDTDIVAFILKMFPCVLILRVLLKELKPRKEIVAVVLAILVYYGKNYDWFPLITAVVGGYLLSWNNHKPFQTHTKMMEGENGTVPLVPTATKKQNDNEYESMMTSQTVTTENGKVIHQTVHIIVKLFKSYIPSR